MTVNKKDMILFVLGLIFMVLCLLLIDKCKEKEPVFVPLKPIDTLPKPVWDSTYINGIDSATAVYDSLVQNWHRLQATEILSK